MIWVKRAVAHAGIIAVVYRARNPSWGSKGEQDPCPEQKIEVVSANPAVSETRNRERFMEVWIPYLSVCRYAITLWMSLSVYFVSNVWCASAGSLIVNFTLEIGHD